jgi:hypothetical protein
MAMSQILDSVRRIIQKWVNTTTRIIQPITEGDAIIYVQTSRRFLPGDQAVITIVSSGVCEPVIIKSVDIENNTITFTTDIANNYAAVTDLMLIKTIHSNYVQGIYLGEPDVIKAFPAITVNGTSRSSEWLTIESTKEKYEIEIGIYIKAASNEDGYRFLMEITDIIQLGLKRNILPLINDLNITSLSQDYGVGSINIEVGDSSLFNDYRRVIFESPDAWQENWVEFQYDSGTNMVKLAQPLSYNFSQSDTSVIVPNRFIFNSWPSQIEYGKIHKGELLKAAVIRWFAEEEEMQYFRVEEPNLR